MPANPIAGKAIVGLRVGGRQQADDGNREGEFGRGIGNASLQALGLDDGRLVPVFRAEGRDTVFLGLAGGGFPRDLDRLIAGGVEVAIPDDAAL